MLRDHLYARGAVTRFHIRASSIVRHMLYQADKIWCGETQIPACSLSMVGSGPGAIRSVALLRVGTAALTFVEVLGYFLITLGLFPSHSAFWLIAGVLFKVGGGLTASVLQNRAGILLSSEMEGFLGSLESHAQEVGALLSTAGVSQAEIRGLSALSQEVYQTELTCYARAATIALGAPCACGVALIVNSASLTGWLVIALGLLSIPLGEYYFKRRAFENEEQLRMGRSAGVAASVRMALKRHLRLTFQVNALSQLPLVLFALRFLAGGFGQLLALFFALTQGLVGLSGALAFQRARTVARRTTKIACHLIETVYHSSLIATPASWERHVQRDRESTPPEIEIKDGILLSNFRPILSSYGKRTALPFAPLSCAISAGSVHLVQAPSGTGKSTLLMSLVHLLDHQGEIYMARNGLVRNVHDLSREQLNRAIYYRRESDVGDQLRLTDLFSNVVQRGHLSLYHEMRDRFGSDLAELAWRAEDSLVEKVIGEANRNSVFPLEMVDSLRRMRVAREEGVSGILKGARGNLSEERMRPDRVFGTLSSGEKRRLMLLLALQEAATDREIALVILDEPLAHLDAENIGDQLETLKAMQNLPSAPAILVVSHLPSGL